MFSDGENNLGKLTGGAIAIVARLENVMVYAIRSRPNTSIVAEGSAANSIRTCRWLRMRPAAAISP